MNTEEFFQRLDRENLECWKVIYQGSFWKHLLEKGLNRDLYIRLMTEIFHFTRHNVQNQALAAIKLNSDRLSLLRYCLHHAYTETGHDLMVLRDLNSIGINPELIKKSQPLPETQAFIAYVYRIATEKDATARLGYSYWAEGCYGYAADLLTAMHQDLNLDDKQLSFWVEHTSIDAVHIEEVKRIISITCTEPELQESVSEVLKTTLYLFGRILEVVYQAYIAETSTTWNKELLTV